MGMWGAFVIHMWIRPPWKECVATVLLGLALRFTYDWAIGEHGYPGSSLIGMGTFLGFVSLVILAVRSLQSPSEERKASRRALAMIGLISYVAICLGFYLALAKLILPRKLDAYLYCFDASLGIPPSFVVGQLLRRYPSLDWAAAMIYNSLGFWFAAMYALHANHGKNYAVSVERLLVSDSFIGFSMFFIFPAMGPKYAFANFPIVPIGVHPAGILMTGIPNAMPSLHFASALLICWMCKPWKWAYRVTAGLALATAFATLGTGEHYLADLIVAVPYSLVILAITAGWRQERKALMLGAALVLFWIAFLRVGHFSGPVSWILVLFTVVVCFAFERRMATRLWTRERSTSGTPEISAPAELLIAQ